MKRQVLATVLLSVLASSAFALPAAEQAIPQVKADAVQFSQTLARSGSQEQENRDYAKGAVAENGSEQANKRAYTEGVTENGHNRLEEKGLIFSGMSPDGKLPEIVEYADHPWFIGVQFHPELKSKPFDPHPLFVSFVEAAIKQSRLV